jgi:FAD/FMN-containing dehydrogenase
MDIREFLKIAAGELPDDRLTYQRAIATFHPESAEEVAKLFLLARRYGRRLFITGFGNHIDPAGEDFEGIVVIKSDRLNGLIRIEPADFYIIAGAGYPLKELNHDLHDHGLFLPHADLPYVGSVGGAIATGLSALHDKHFLPISRYFLMSQIVVPQGDIINPGSACFKSVSGFDIVRMFSPSWGLLGMIITATLRVLPLSIKGDFADLVIQEQDFRSFSDRYKNPGDNQSAIYSIKIKNKFDPDNILPLIEVAGQSHSRSAS